MSHRRMRAPSLGVVLLAGHIINFGVNKVPPATLALIASQTAVFLDMFPKYFPTAQSVCISSYLVLYDQKWMRLILSAFYHGSDMHLYYNMLSLLYKGSWLESRLGTLYFIYLISVFTAMTSIVYVGLGFFLSQVMGSNSYLLDCAVGFSGVLFALKVLAAHYTPSGPQYVFGIVPVPSKHIYWAELLLIQVLVPNASFVGHLAGILVGTAYVLGPLRIIMHAFFQPRAKIRQSYSTQRTPRPSTSFSGSGRARPSAPDPTDIYDESTPSSYTGDAHSRNYSTATSPDLQDLRTRRTQYYQ
uniref:Peptidase S54 rhomboid domain-containing protein n=1 Tax=Arion vulgaris TaxID=1028688 RepID=A0A0B7AHF8_9EUPU